MSAAIAPVLALVLLAGAALLALAALLSRSVLAACAQLAAAGALIAAMLALLGRGEGALVVALLAAGWAPVMLLGAMLLTSRINAAGARTPWFSIAAAAAASLALFWASVGWAPLLASAAAASTLSVGAWFAPLLLAVAAGCLGLLGHGERGALDHSGEA